MILSLRRNWTEFQLAFSRLGILNFLVGLCIFAALAIWIGLLPEMRARQLALQAAREQVAQRLKMEAAEPAAGSSNARRLNEFYDLLGEAHYAEQQVKTLFAIAAKNELSLNQAEYRLTEQDGTQFQAYQVTLPLRGSYQSIRGFCEQVLLALPFVSLDEVNFKREAIGNPSLEARVVLTIHLSTIRRPAAEKVS